MKTCNQKYFVKKNVHRLPLATGNHPSAERKVPASNTETKERERGRTGGIPGEPGTEHVVASASPGLQDPTHPLGSGSECHHLSLHGKCDRVTSDNAGPRGWEPAQTASEEEEGESKSSIK